MKTLANKAAIENSFKDSSVTILGSPVTLEDGIHYGVSTGHVGETDIKPKDSEAIYRIIAATVVTPEGVRVNVTVRDAAEACQLLEPNLTVRFEVKTKTAKASGNEYKTCEILSAVADKGDGINLGAKDAKAVKTT